MSVLINFRLRIVWMDPSNELLRYDVETKWKSFERRKRGVAVLISQANIHMVGFGHYFNTDSISLRFSLVDIHFKNLDHIKSKNLDNIILEKIFSKMKDGLTILTNFLLNIDLPI